MAAKKTKPMVMNRNQRKMLEALGDAPTTVKIEKGKKKMKKKGSK